MRWWEIVVATLLVLLALLWIAGGLLVAGLVLLFLLTLIVERYVAGAHARTRLAESPHPE